VTSGFRRDVDKTCAVLGCYTASSSNPLLTFRHNVSVPSTRVKKSNEAAQLDSLTLEEKTDTLSPDIGKILPLDAA
jgi:hypothetical protein